MKIAYARSALRSLSALPPDIRSRIVSKIEDYATNPAGFSKVVSLSGREGARLRVGDYRIVFTVSDDTLIIEAAGHRKDIYR